MLVSRTKASTQEEAQAQAMDDLVETSEEFAFPRSNRAISTDQAMHPDPDPCLCPWRCSGWAKSTLMPGNAMTTIANSPFSLVILRTRESLPSPSPREQNHQRGGRAT